MYRDSDVGETSETALHVETRLYRLELRMELDLGANALNVSVTVLFFSFFYIPRANVAANANSLLDYFNWTIWKGRRPVQMSRITKHPGLRS